MKDKFIDLNKLQIPESILNESINFFDFDVSTFRRIESQHINEQMF